MRKLGRFDLALQDAEKATFERDALITQALFGLGRIDEARERESTLETYDD